MKSELEPSGRGRFSRRKARPALLKVMILLPQDLRDRLDHEATERGYDSRSQLVRVACEQFIASEPAAA